MPHEDSVDACCLPDCVSLHIKKDLRLVKYCADMFILVFEEPNRSSVLGARGILGEELAASDRLDDERLKDYVKVYHSLIWELGRHFLHHTE